MSRDQLALHALDAYALISPEVTFLRHNENMVFHVMDTQAGHAYLLRLHLPCVAAFEGERLRPQGIESELCWLEALSQETSLVLQRPVRTKQGNLLTVIAGEQSALPCSLLQWIEADPFPATPSPDQVKRLGTIIAMLHTHARAWSPPGSFARPVYDLAFHRRQINTLAQGVQDGTIREEDFLCIQQTLEVILTTLAAAQESLMLIHADLWRGNLLASETNVSPIDFSLCGFGSPLFDLGTCLPGIPAQLRPLLLDAYQQQAQLPAAYARLTDAYFLLSRMGSYVYLLSNPAEQAWLRERIPRFVAQECRLFLDEQALLFGGAF